MAKKKNKEVTAEEILEVYGGSSEAPQDEGDNLIKFDEEEQ